MAFSRPLFCFFCYFTLNIFAIISFAISAIIIYITAAPIDNMYNVLSKCTKSNILLMAGIKITHSCINTITNTPKSNCGFVKIPVLSTDFLSERITNANRSSAKDSDIKATVIACCTTRIKKQNFLKGFQ